MYRGLSLGALRTTALERLIESGSDETHKEKHKLSATFLITPSHRLAFFSQSPRLNSLVARLIIGTTFHSNDSTYTLHFFY